jgi:hypothetical protein
MALDAGDIEGLRAKYGDNREIGKPRALFIPKSSSPRLRSSLRKILRGLPFKRLKSPEAFERSASVCAISVEVTDLGDQR